MKTETAIDYLVKEFSEILGKIVTNPIQDLLMVDAINKAKEKEKQQIIDAVNFHDKKCISVSNTVICKIKPSCKMLFEYDGKAGEQYYNETFKD